MRTLYLDCNMGAAGDMLTAALIELVPEPDKFAEKLNSLGIPNVKFEKHSAVKCGITGTGMTVTVDGVEEDEHMYEHHHHHEHEHEHHEHHGHEHEHEHHHGHHHSGMHDIEHIVSHLDVSQKGKNDILAIDGLIAEAESIAHGVPVTEIHFHEVGTMDAVADITAVCMLMEEISPDEVIASPVRTGFGQVQCAHGILPVPAPAAAHILQNIPIYSGNIEGEMCTPTGAALLKHFVTRFGEMPVMTVQKTGYGMGKRDFPAANCLNCIRAMLGETSDSTDVMYELSCNVDDMTAEEISFAMDMLFEGGAAEVYTIPIGMKRSRPGTLLRVICSKENKEKLVRLMFAHTSTIGIRETETRRYVLDRKTEIIKTPYGDVRKKISCGYDVKKEKYEYADLAEIAKKQSKSIPEIRKIIEENENG